MLKMSMTNTTSQMKLEKSQKEAAGQLITAAAGILTLVAVAISPVAAIGIPLQIWGLAKVWNWAAK